MTIARMRPSVTADLVEHCGFEKAVATKAVVESLRTAFDLTIIAMYGEDADSGAYFEVAQQIAKEEVATRIEAETKRVAKMEALVAKMETKAAKKAAKGQLYVRFHYINDRHMKKIGTHTVTLDEVFGVFWTATRGDTMA